ncbi:MAG TPA: XRE family transcriptional regulator [Gemmataceae bacterium]|jgi:Zn-dependent peptidase ImmA (M78 family)/DNA-binding XRE family transcriptional regulator
MSHAINPEMLVLARESRGMSQKDLAETISVSQAKISKYENGLFTVSEDDLEAIAKVLGYTQEFFFQRDRVYGLGSSFLFHRQRVQVPMHVQRKVQAEINILRMQVERLLRGVEIDAECRFEPIDADAFDGDVARIAALVRAAWKLPLGPVANVTASIEAAGGIVLKCSFETNLIDAAHLLLPGLPPLFFVNRDLPGDRLRWTLAHEAGHAVMHQNPTGDVEDQANCFASEFLMPAEEIANQLDDLTMRQAAVLKQQWKVSMAAIVMRAHDLGRISEYKYRKLNIGLSAQGYKMVEPFPIEVEEPQVVRQMVEMHRTDLGYNDFDLARLLFSPDPQFFGTGQRIEVFKFDNQPFFAFFPEHTGRRSSG